MELPDKFSKAIDNFTKLSGVGKKTAMRYLLDITSWSQNEIISLGKSIQDMATINRCRDCGIFANENKCNICSSEIRKSNKLICVVETIADCLAIEKSGEYKGLFHILGGVLDPLSSVGPEKLTISKLLFRIKEMEIAEVILALNPSVEGDITCSYIKEKIGSGVKVRRIGLGIPIGGTLEYLDSLTIGKALENRRTI